ncbi:MAG: heparan-alpha-glucosaminide N-acetyltransferase [Candidatus Aenigmarchaeota archaeon]|nr:heparan-alpha-glucosaminide N-acetyltransferase [Candidatus Aenigmarchaeota archaeon]
MQKRFWEIDALRGIAVILMVIFNYAFTLKYFHVFEAGGGELFWFYFPRAVAGVFIFLAGLSLAISYARRKDARYVVKRGLWIFLIGIAITLVTFFVVPQGTIYFGILHLIGLSIILSLLLIKFDRLILFAGALFIIVGNYITTLTVKTPYLLWLGLMPENFYTFDYFPLLPWFGLFLFGMYAGKLLYKNGKRIYRIKERNPFLCRIGGHSLVIYIIHQPILIAILYLFGYNLFIL